MQFEEETHFKVHEEVHQRKVKNDGWIRHYYWEPDGISPQEP